MIRIHEANSSWWGRPVGLITDTAFFNLAMATRATLLAPYAWAEFRAPLMAAPSSQVLHDAGFAWTDVQVSFRIGLKSVPDSPSLSQYECVSAAERPFTISAGDFRPFEHERFLQLPGATHTLLGARYATWANELVARSPDWCLSVSLGGHTQGWFLAAASGSTVMLTLAMLAADATASGQHLYQRCMREFAERGGKVGQAAFSVRNSSVMNIYSGLGAKFTSASGVWVWIAESTRKMSTIPQCGSRETWLPDAI